MSKDLALPIGPDQPWLSTTGFLDKINDNLIKKAMLSKRQSARLSACPRSCISDFGGQLFASGSCFEKTQLKSPAG